MREIPIETDKFATGNENMKVWLLVFIHHRN